jgi:hypothetical protein
MASPDVGVGANRPGTATARARDRDRGVAEETKWALKTTELLAYLGAVAAVVIAGAVANNFGARDVWLYVTILTVGYVISRGLAKCGSGGPSPLDREGL